MLKSYPKPKPRVIVTDKLKSYVKPIKQMCLKTDHRKYKGLNNRVEKAHQPNRRKEKSPGDIQQTLSLMGKVCNIFAVGVVRYINNAKGQRDNFQKAKSIWDEAMQVIATA